MKKINIRIIGNNDLVSFKRRELLLYNKFEDIYVEFKKKDEEDILIITSTEKKYIKELANNRNAKTIFSLPDLIIEPPYKWMRQPYKTIFQMNGIIKKKKMINNLKKFDSIIVASSLQKKTYLSFNSNVFELVDSIPNELLINEKQKVISKDHLDLGIECGGLNIHSILNNSSFCEAIDSMSKIHLHIVIDDAILSRTYQFQNVHLELKRRFAEKVSVYNHTLNNLINLIKKIDIAVIPVDTSCKFAFSKPANRPLIMLANYIPVVCSPIPSYIELSKKFYSVFLAGSKQEWIYMIRKAKKNKENSLYDESFKKIREKYSVKNFIKKYRDIIYETLKT